MAIDADRLRSSATQMFNARLAMIAPSAIQRRLRHNPASATAAGIHPSLSP